MLEPVPSEKVMSSLPPAPRSGLHGGTITRMAAAEYLHEVVALLPYCQSQVHEME